MCICMCSLLVIRLCVCVCIWCAQLTWFDAFFFFICMLKWWGFYFSFGGILSYRVWFFLRIWLLLGVLFILGDFSYFSGLVFFIFWGVFIFLFLRGLIFWGFFDLWGFWFVNSELPLLILLKFSWHWVANDYAMRCKWCRPLEVVGVGTPVLTWGI